MVTDNPMSTNNLVGLPSSTTSFEIVGPSDGFPFFSNDQSSLKVSAVLNSAS